MSNYKIENVKNSELNKIKSDFINSKDINVSKICSYFKVCDENEVYALFDIRDAIGYAKQMKIYYSKSLVIGDEEKSDKNKIIKLANVLICIFTHVKNLSLKLGKAKIYSENKNEYTIFSLMAQELQKSSKDKYEVSLYSKWIEIAYKQ